MMLFIKLLLAHLLGDFVLQPTSWVEEKEHKKYKSPKLYLHALLHFGLILLVTMNPHYLFLAAIITISHLLIDAAKLQLQNTKNKRILFIADQVLHLAVIAGAVYLTTGARMNFSMPQLNSTLIITTGVVFLTTPTSVIVRIVLSKWAPATEIKTDLIETKSLQHAGMMIGYLERVLVLIFILTGQWTAIGFLITAKSVFRFSDLKMGQDRKLTEYILIGTLLSFGIALITGIVISKLLPTAGIGG